MFLVVVTWGCFPRIGFYCKQIERVNLKTPREPQLIIARYLSVHLTKKQPKKLQNSTAWTLNTSFALVVVHEFSVHCENVECCCCSVCCFKFSNATRFSSTEPRQAQVTVLWFTCEVLAPYPTSPENTFYCLLWLVANSFLQEHCVRESTGCPSSRSHSQECHMAQEVITRSILGQSVWNLDTKQILESSAKWKHKILPLSYMRQD